MDTKILLTAGLLFLVAFGISRPDAGNPASSDETIRIYATPDTKGIVESWTSIYSVNNPGTSFEISTINLSEFNTALTNENTLGILLKSPEVKMAGGTMWQTVVGRDVIVPIINRENPYTEILNKKGVTAKDLSEAILTQQSKTWDLLLKNKENTPVHLYVLNEPDVKLAVSKFLEIDPLKINAFESKSADEILSTIKSDKYAIAFTRLADIVDNEKKDLLESLALLPVDRNDNGQIDFNEKFTADLESFERAIWIGKYPKSLMYNIYAVSGSKPENEALTGFLSWIVTSGQQGIAENGYTEIAFNEVQSNLTKLNPSTRFTTIEPSAYSQTKMIILEVIAIGLMAFFIAVFFIFKGKSVRILNDGKLHQKVLNEGSISIPRGLFFDKTHTWVFMKKDGTIKVGIDDFLQHVTGNFTKIVMKGPGEKLAKNEPALTLVNEGKKLNIYAPVSGTIKEINEDLVDFPSIINSSPYSWGWIYTLEPSNWAREITFLQMADSYKAWIKREFIRLKDFLGSVSQLNMPEGQPVYQEGGELQDHVLKQMGPKVWEDFQVKFIDTADMN